MRTGRNKVFIALLYRENGQSTCCWPYQMITPATEIMTIRDVYTLTCRELN